MESKMPDNVRDPAAIRAGIERARQEIEQSVAELRTNVSETLDWRNYVRAHPVAVFGGAVVLGVCIARITSSR
jgi:hypothetical protein